MLLTALPVIPFLLAIALSVNGIKSRKLSPSGAATAFIVGFFMMAAPVRGLGITLIVFYLLASRATKCEFPLHERSLGVDCMMVILDGHKRKAQLEEGFQNAGYRNGWQVLCNSVAAFFATIVWSVRFAPNVLPWSLLAFSNGSPQGPLYDGESWCPLSKHLDNGLSRAMLFVVLGYVHSDSSALTGCMMYSQFACCLGDTLASELGILSSSPPLLITTLKPVPPGTNGGISLGGTIASVIGGCVVGLTLFVSLVMENTVCRAEWMDILPPLMFWGMASGALGSLVRKCVHWLPVRAVVRPFK